MTKTLLATGDLGPFTGAAKAETGLEGACWLQPSSPCSPPTYPIFRATHKGRDGEMAEHHSCHLPPAPRLTAVEEDDAPKGVQQDQH